MKLPNRKNCYVDPLTLDRIDFLLKSFYKDSDLIQSRSEVIALAIFYLYRDRSNNIGDKP